MKLTIHLSRLWEGWRSEIPELGSGYCIGTDPYDAIRWAKINALMTLAGEARAKIREIPQTISFELADEIPVTNEDDGEPIHWSRFDGWHNGKLPECELCSHRETKRTQEAKQELDELRGKRVNVDELNVDKEET